MLRKARGALLLPGCAPLFDTVVVGESVRAHLDDVQKGSSVRRSFWRPIPVTQHEKFITLVYVIGEKLCGRYGDPSITAFSMWMLVRLWEAFDSSGSFLPRDGAKLALALNLPGVGAVEANALLLALQGEKILAIHDMERFRIAPDESARWARWWARNAGLESSSGRSTRRQKVRARAQKKARREANPTVDRKVPFSATVGEHFSLDGKRT